MQGTLDTAVRLSTADEALIADAGGEVIARRRSDGPAGRGGTIAASAGFRHALAGQTAHGFSRERQGLLEQAVYVPLRTPESGPPLGVLRLASFLDQTDVDRFRSRTRLEISLFFGEERLATTLRQSSGAPLTDIGADTAMVREVMGGGREIYRSHDLPIGRVRNLFVPLTGPDGTRVGMFAVALPVTTLTEQLRDALFPVLPVTAVITLAGATVAYLLVRRMHRPVLMLAAAAARLGAGDFATPIPPVKAPELAPLAEELERTRTTMLESTETLAKERARQRALFTALPSPVILTALDGCMTLFNPAAVALFGDPERLVGRAIQELLPFIPAGTERADQRAAWHGSVTDVTGRSVDLEVTRTLLPEGRLPASHVYILYDISRHAELNRMREQLLYSVAHELRNPMAVLENALEILSEEFTTLSADEFARLMESAHRTTMRLRGLMEDLLSAGNIQSGRFTVHRRPTKLAAILDEALDAVESMVAERGQRVDCDRSSDNLYVLADQRYARQVLANLLSNASKYSPVGEAIRVEVEPVEGSVRIAVVDRGRGIPAEQRAGLFERFYRVRAGNDAPGVGLGLAIAKGIVDAHGGTIGVESEIGKGTTVWFTLPLARGPA